MRPSCGSGGADALIRIKAPGDSAGCDEFSTALTRIKAPGRRGGYPRRTLMKSHAKLLLGSAALALVALAGCSRSENAAVAAPAAATESARPADGRAIAITANDTMKFDVTEIRARPGEALAVTLTNTGTVPKFSMGHNWVLLAANTDLAAFAAAATEAATTEYVPASFKPGVLAATKLLGPKESDTVRFHAPKQPGRYPFICAFPGHMQVGMKGELIVE